MADDIAQWLEGLGLDQYAQAFAENRIELDILPDLCEGDLEKLDIPLGDRKRLLRAIADLSDESEEDAPIASERTVPGPLPTEAERRQLTVLFCDLIGSTALSERLDPEDNRAVLLSYQEAVTAAVERFGGHVAKYLGDGVLAYFGWPRAHENDAERAVRAGLDAAADVARLPVGEAVSLQARVGIASGLVVAGDLVGKGVAEKDAIAGETPNLAARLQELAEPGAVVISEATHRLTGALFECKNLGSVPLKGFSNSLQAWSVKRAQKTEIRFDALRAGTLTELVGREEEIETLLRRWRRAAAGEGQLALIAGEPGIGKSRLARELRERIAGEQPIVLLMQFSPHHVNSAMFPFVEQMRLRAGFQPTDTNAVKIEKLEKLILEADQSPEKGVPILAPMFGVDAAERYSAPEVTPERHKAMLFDWFSERLSNRLARSAVLYLVEDAHWADPTTLEMIGLHLERFLGRDRILFLITHRPEFSPPWSGQANTTLLTLSRLDKSQSTDLVNNASGGAELSRSIVAQIVERTDGVPLFVEELTKAVLESSGESPSADIEVPATLQDSLEARLDRLGKAREVAQIGAVIGREFSYELLEAAVPSDVNLTETLDKLAEADLVFQRGQPPTATYTFKHALIQDTAYASLLRSRRASLHENIARVIEEKFPHHKKADPGVLARHFTEANKPEQAIPYWNAAGQIALERSANDEAAAHFSAALCQLELLPETRERDGLELGLRLRLGPTLMAARSYGADEVEACYNRARELAERLDDSNRLFTSRFGLWQMNNFRGKVTVAARYASELIESTETSENSGHRLQAHHTFSTSALFLGNPLVVCEHARAGVALYDREAHADHKYIYGAHDPGVCGLGIDGVGSFLLEFPDRSTEKAEASLDLANELSHANTTAVAYCWLMATKFMLCDFPAVIEYGEAGKELCEEFGLSNWQNFISLVQAGARNKLAGTNEASEIFDRTERWRASGTLNFWQWFLTLRAEAQAHQGDRDDALATVAEALDHGLKNGEVWFDAELYRLQARLLLEMSSSATEEAEAALLQSLNVARAQQAKAWELRSATDLARLWGESGKRNEARSLLAPIYGQYREGFDTIDLNDAKVLLSELN